MTDPTRIVDSDPGQFEDKAGSFWFELVIRNRDDSYAVRLTEVEGTVKGNAEDGWLSEEDMHTLLVQVLSNLLEVLRGEL